ncbi:hypothetical protein SBA6_1120033 [Candidatus Sulfopaludibacter sp. SbA6]|nr:hypothetical protein SBA6_1120033 [Candidatus Sulfopaludibacter sp. SbA6]
MGRLPGRDAVRGEDRGRGSESGRLGGGLAILFVHRNLEGAQEALILGSELDFAGGFEITLRFLGYFGVFVVVLFAVFIPPVETNGGLQDKEDIVAGSLDFADRFRDPVGFGKGIVDRVSQFLHEVLQWLFHKLSPFSGCAGYQQRSTRRASTPPVPIVVEVTSVHKHNQ